MPNFRSLLRAALLPLLLLGGGLVALYSLSNSLPEVATGAADYTCSMHPQVRLPKGSKCPICGMPLIPVSRQADLQLQLRERAGVQTESIRYRSLTKELRTIGRLDYNERQTAYISARIAGRTDRVHADFIGIRVKKGDHLADIYSPDLIVAQDELIRGSEAGRNGGTFAEASIEAARTKLRLLGILPEQIRAMEASRERAEHVTIYAPIGGTIIEKNVRAGQYVKEGDILYRIADLDPIWLYLDIYEYDLGWVRFGQAVDVTVEAYPGETFRGTVAFIDPFLNDQTRSLKVRVNLKNADRRLKPAMYASATLRIRVQSDGRPEPTGFEGKYVCPMHPEVVREKPGPCTLCEMPLEQVPPLRSAPAKTAAHDVNEPGDSDRVVVPPATDRPPPGMVAAIRSSAVLDTGRRQVTYRRNRDGSFELVELTLGPRAMGTDDDGKPGLFYPILKGPLVGEEVAVSGGFLLDSQRQIEGMPSLLFPEGQSGAGLHAGHGGGPPQSPSPPKEGHKH